MSTIRWSGPGGFAIIPEWLLDAQVEREVTRRGKHTGKVEHTNEVRRGLICDRAIRLYALLARYADKQTGHAIPARKTLAERMGCSTSVLDIAIGELVQSGALTVRQRQRQDGSLSSNDYVLHPVPVSRDTPTGLPVEVAPSAGQQEERESIEREDLEEPNGSSRSEMTTRALSAEIPAPDPLAPASPTPRSMPRVVDRAAVTISEAGLAVKVLAAYNELTGQAYASKEWLSKIVMRIREHPELGLDEHYRVVEVALADPWWKGRPTPSVVYGNAAQFERCLDAMLAEPLRNGSGNGTEPHTKFGRRDVSAGEMLAAAERLEQTERKEIERATD